MRKENLVMGTVLALVAGCAASASAPGGSGAYGTDGGSHDPGSAAEDGGASTAPASGDDGGGFGNVLTEAGSPGSGSGSSGGSGSGSSGSGSGSGGGSGGSGSGGSGSGGSGSGGGSGGSGPPDGGTTFVVATPISGTPSPTTAPLKGPGVILMGGGTDVDAAFVWMHDTLAGAATTKLGNVVVFNTQSAPPSVDNAYAAYIFGVAPFQSVQTLYLGGYKNDGNSAPAATATDVAIAAWYVDQADAVFFAGGDQADYVSWYKTSPALMTAITALYKRGGVIGGTSAGCAIMGPYVFDDLAADDLGADPATADVIKNPYESSISFTRNMLSFTSLPSVFTDPHFVTRDRFGRLAGFVARQYADGNASGGVVGVGIDESNALVVDKSGLAHLYQQPSGTEDKTGTGAYILQPTGGATTCTSGKALAYTGVKVTRLSTQGQTFDFSKGCGSGVQFTIGVDGSKSSPYSPSPYTTAGTASACP